MWMWFIIGLRILTLIEFICVNMEKKRSYNPDIEKITSIYDALVHQKFLTNAIQRIEEMKVSIFSTAYLFLGVIVGINNFSSPF